MIVQDLFASEKVNTARQYEADLARGFVAIIMVFSHVILFMGNNVSSGLYSFFDIVASEPGAPVFMTLLGINVVYSRHNTPKVLFRRGIKLFLAGYLLNVYRSLIPYLFLGSVNEFACDRGFFFVDIMQFAGLALMFMALLRKRGFSGRGILLLSLLFTGINQFLMFPKGVIKDSFLLSALVDLFCPVTHVSCFPFLTWFFFPAFGLWFGEYLLCCKNKDKFYSILFPLGFGGMIYVFYQFYRLYPNYVYYYYGSNYYYMGVKNVLLASLFVVFSLSFWHFAGKILPKPVSGFMTFLSNNLTVVFFASWLIIAPLVHAQTVLGWKLNGIDVMMIGVLVMVFTVALTKLWRKKGGVL